MAAINIEIQIGKLTAAETNFRMFMTLVLVLRHFHWSLVRSHPCVFARCANVQKPLSKLWKILTLTYVTWNESTYKQIYQYLKSQKAQRTRFSFLCTVLMCWVRVNCWPKLWEQIVQDHGLSFSCLVIMWRSRLILQAEWKSHCWHLKTWSFLKKEKLI